MLSIGESLDGGLMLRCYDVCVCRYCFVVPIHSTSLAVRSSGACNSLSTVLSSSSRSFSATLQASIIMGSFHENVRRRCIESIGAHPISRSAVKAAENVKKNEATKKAPHTAHATCSADSSRAEGIPPRRFLLTNVFWSFDSATFITGVNYAYTTRAMGSEQERAILGQWTIEQAKERERESRLLYCDCMSVHQQEQRG